MNREEKETPAPDALSLEKFAGVGVAENAAPSIDDRKLIRRIDLWYVPTVAASVADNEWSR